MDHHPSAQDLDEPFDVLRADGAATGIVKSRAHVHRDGDWHRALHVWVAGIAENCSPFLMAQRRGPGKDTWPNRLDATVGGHYRAGETVRETLREIEEEIGISVELHQLRPLGVRICANETDPGIIDREIQDLFLLRDDRPLERFQPNPVELAALVRLPLDGLIPFLAGETSEAAGMSIAPGESDAVPLTVRSGDFIPAVDRYFLRVSIAARNVLRGDDYVTI